MTNNKHLKWDGTFSISVRDFPSAPAKCFSVIMHGTIQKPLQDVISDILVFNREKILHQYVKQKKYFVTLPRIWKKAGKSRKRQTIRINSKIIPL